MDCYTLHCSLFSTTSTHTHTHVIYYYKLFEYAPCFIIFKKKIEAGTYMLKEVRAQNQKEPVIRIYINLAVISSVA